MRQTNIHTRRPCLPHTDTTPKSLCSAIHLRLRRGRGKPTHCLKIMRHIFSQHLGLSSLRRMSDVVWCGMLASNEAAAEWIAEGGRVAAWKDGEGAMELQSSCGCVASAK